MESFKEIGDVNKRILFLLGCYAHIRYLLEKCDIGTNGGIVLYISSDSQTFVEDTLRKLGFLRHELNARSVSALNFEGVYAKCYFSSNPASIYRFLSSKGFLPVVICKGIVPDFLEDYDSILSLEEYDVSGFIDFNFDAELKEFINFTHMKAGDIIKVFLNRKKAVVSKNLLARVLEFTLVAYRYYLFESGKDYCGSFDECLEMINKRAGNIFDVECAEDIVLEVGSCLIDFVRQGRALVGDINKILGNLINAVDEKRAILFDSKYYYVPEGLFREATVSLREVVSYPLLKAKLKEAGCLVCDASTQSFTTKKIVYNGYGASVRLRFLKLKREMLDDARHLSLSELGGTVYENR